METKTLNQWMRAMNIIWTEGNEQMYKGTMTKSEAEQLLGSLATQGAVRYA
jgi:hypothetical protein